jgi:hypothetical protein
VSGTGNSLPVLRSNKRLLGNRHMCQGKGGVSAPVVFDFVFSEKPPGLRPPATSCRCHPGVSPEIEIAIEIEIVGALATRCPRGQVCNSVRTRCRCHPRLSISNHKRISHTETTCNCPAQGIARYGQFHQSVACLATCVGNTGDRPAAGGIITLIYLRNQDA